MITLTERERNTLTVLGKRYKGKEKQRNYGKVEPIVKERIEDLFIATNGNDDSFAFRGIAPTREKWLDNPKLYHYCPR